MSATDAQSRDHIPTFIRQQLDNFPVLPGEDRQELRSIFRSLAYTGGETPQTAIESILVFRTSVITYDMQRLERMRGKIIRHHHHAAVLALVARAEIPIGAADPAITFYKRRVQTLDYFSSDAEKQSAVNAFIAAGYEADAVEVEAYLQALPQLVILDRQIATAERQLLAIFKELDRRYTRRAKEIQVKSRAIIANARSGDKAAERVS